MAKKLTAKQKRIRREKERAERAAYMRGEIKPQIGKSRAARRKAAAESKRAQAAIYDYRRRSSAEVDTLRKPEIEQDVLKLWNEAYSRYRAIKEAGISNVATALYEEHFAGMDVYDATINTNRFQANKLKQWLKRKDTRTRRAKKNAKRTLEYVKGHGFPNATQTEMKEFFRGYDKFVDYIGGVPKSLKKQGGIYIKVWSEVYKKYKENPDYTLEAALNDAKTKLFAGYEQSYDPSAFAENPLGF